MRMMRSRKRRRIKSLTSPEMPQTVEWKLSDRWKERETIRPTGIVIFPYQENFGNIPPDLGNEAPPLS